MIKPNRIKAILSLAPSTGFTSDNDDNVIEWDIGSPKTGVSQPTKEEVDVKLASMISDWDALEYSRNRQAEYPDWGTQLNKIYDDGLTKWKSEMVDPVKAKWPKDNSGPV